MKLNAVLLFFFLFSLTLAAKVRRIGSGLDENQIFEENGVDTKMNTLEKLWRAMKYRFGQEEENKNNQYDSQLDLQIDDQQENQAENRLNEDKERVEGETEDKSGSRNVTDEDNINGPMNKTIEQNDQEEKPESPQLEDRPNQMAPITKALLYIRPKRDERWVMLEEGYFII
jgi:hypothetical protein